ATASELKLKDFLPFGLGGSNVAERLTAASSKDLAIKREAEKADGYAAAALAAKAEQQKEINAAMAEAGKEEAKTTFELLSTEEKLNVLLAFRKSLVDELKQNPK